MPARRWTTEQLRDASARIGAGEERDTVAAGMGTTWKKLYVVMWKRGVDTHTAELAQLKRSDLEGAWERMRRGEHPRTVSTALGVNHDRLLREMRKAGLNARHVASRWRRANWGETIYRMRCDGASTRAICAELGIPYYRRQSSKIREHLIRYCRQVHLEVPTITGRGTSRRVERLRCPRWWDGMFDDRGVARKRIEMRRLKLR